MRGIGLGVAGFAEGWYPADGSVGGQPPAAAPWHLVLGFLYVTDFMGDLLSHSSSALPPCT